MKILALELSTAQGSLAWVDDGDAIVRQWANDRHDSGLFFKNLDDVTAKFGRPGKVVVGLGPGSYAGVRIAISAAIGLQRATQAELLGYPSICAMETEARDYVVIGDARRRSFYWARVCGRNLVGNFALCSEPELRHKLAALETGVPVVSSDRLTGFGNIERRFPSAAMLAQLAREPDRSFSLPPLEPIYLREPHVTVPRPRTE
jgi:tRNA threonylcarbamoyladenosine biosynthesis protein TsaB